VIPAALAQDAENDAVFNIFSLIFPYAGILLNSKYLDPIGGLLLSLYSGSWLLGRLYCVVPAP
jgi:divalent metal cation (Fe/Co/Zn/Cd) transporter